MWRCIRVLNRREFPPRQLLSVIAKFTWKEEDNARNYLNHLFDPGALWRVAAMESHSRNWGYMPTGGLGLVLVVVVILVLLGRI